MSRIEKFAAKPVCIFISASCRVVGGMQQGGRRWVWGCAFGGLDYCLIFLVCLPGMGQHTHCTTLHHTAPHCNTLQHTLLSTMQKWRSFFLAIDSTGLLQTPFLARSRFFCALSAANSSKTSGFLKPRFAWFLGGVGYLSNKRGCSSLQRISSNFLLWTQNDSSVIL